MVKTSDIPAPLMAALRKLHEQRVVMAADLDVRDARKKVMDSTHLLQAAENRLDELEQPYRNAMREIAEYIKGHALELEASAEYGGERVKYTKGFTRTTWKSTLVEEIFLEMQDKGPRKWVEKLLPARTVTEVQPKVEVEDV